MEVQGRLEQIQSEVKKIRKGEQENNKNTGVNN